MATPAATMGADSNGAAAGSKMTSNADERRDVGDVDGVDHVAVHQRAVQRDGEVATRVGAALAEELNRSGRVPAARYR